MYREQLILELVRGKDVLDCGGVDHSAHEMKQERGDWLHALVAREARSCLGVDILDARVAAINASGTYRFVVANAESLPYEEAFDVVVAGELIEHIYNAGMFLDSAWRALRDGGKLVITTPNAYALSLVGRALVCGTERCHPEHTCYYSPQTLTYLVARHGFEIEHVGLLERPARSRLIGCLRSAMSRLRPLLSEQLLLVARKLPQQEKYSDKW